MKTRDIVLSTNVTSRSEWLGQRKKAEFWKPLEKTAKVLVEDFAAPPQRTNAGSVKTEEGTDLNHALESVLQRQKNLKAMLLLTDGDWNRGKSPVGTATRFREQGIPIFAVAVGRETPVPDLSLEAFPLLLTVCSANRFRSRSKSRATFARSENIDRALQRNAGGSEKGNCHSTAERASGCHRVVPKRRRCRNADAAAARRSRRSTARQ
jgi:hypothetical protein